MSKEDSPGATATGTERAAENREQFTKAIDGIRGRSDLAAKALGGIGTAAITALGYAKLTDVFPYEGPCWATVPLFAGPFLMVVAVWFLFRGFYAAGQSLITSSDVDQTVARNEPEMDDDEIALIKSAYEDTARLNGVRTLRAYEARGLRFERIAERAPKNRAKELEERATRIATEVSATHARAATFVIRHRANQALFRWQNFFLLLAFASGWYATSIGANAIQSHRSDKIAVAKECAEARGLEKIVESELPDTCGKAPSPPPPKTTSEPGRRVKVVVAAATAVVECQAEAKAGMTPPGDCRQLERALTAATRRP